jgi:hypothetical protein
MPLKPYGKFSPGTVRAVVRLASLYSYRSIFHSGQEAAVPGFKTVELGEDSYLSINDLEIRAELEEPKSIEEFAIEIYNRVDREPRFSYPPGEDGLMYLADHLIDLAEQAGSVNPLWYSKLLWEHRPDDSRETHSHTVKSAEEVTRDIYAQLDQLRRRLSGPPGEDGLMFLADHLLDLAQQTESVNPYRYNQLWWNHRSGGSRDTENYIISPHMVVEGLWTAAQVAATSVALGAAVSSGAKRWRRASLPRGSRLTLTITPAEGDKRDRVHIVIKDIHTKTTNEITQEIKQALTRYAHDDSDEAGESTP